MVGLEWDIWDRAAAWGCPMEPGEQSDGAGPDPDLSLPRLRAWQQGTSRLLSCPRFWAGFADLALEVGASGRVHWDFSGWQLFLSQKQGFRLLSMGQVVW